MATNVEVNKNQNENSVNLIRRFTKRVQESGVLPKVRSIRYNERPLSKVAKKAKTLKSIAKKKEIEKLKKLGKMVESKRR